MLYLWLKYIHILSSTLLFGTGIGTACIMLYGHLKKNIVVMGAINEYVVLIDWISTGSTIIIQPVTGLAMVYIAGFPLSSLWILVSLVFYILALICWLIVVYLQIKIRNITSYAAKTNSPLPAAYYQYFKYWFMLGWPAFISFLIIFYLMTFKPYTIPF
ncbi:DUF2269 family protein [Legionella gresilensis]|uniref:DUF2269 family protein n=1 Tax=Legionella gresilensis TaxID=91823 RepID=UPI001040E8F8|nr:DUF2269 domain-containing protein [Legionella gresilensis]